MNGIITYPKRNRGAKRAEVLSLAFSHTSICCSISTERGRSRRTETPTPESKDFSIGCHYDPYVDTGPLTME